MPATPIDPTALCIACNQPVGEAGFSVAVGTAPICYACPTCVSSAAVLVNATQIGIRKLMGWVEARKVEASPAAPAPAAPVEVPDARC